MIVRRHDAADSVIVQRYDRAEAKLDPASRTAQGYLRGHAAIAVPGVMLYEDEHGNVRRELVLPEELHKVDSLRSLASMPVTLGHPDEDVTPENVGELGVGDVGENVEVLEESGHVRVVVVLRRADALAAVDGGTLEVSPGYVTRLEMTSGVHPIYGAYDAIQRDRLYNHLAIVDEARGGHSIRLRADARRQVTRADSKPSQPGASPMIPSLLSLALLCGLPVTSKDGKVVRKSDQTPYTAEELIAAIAEAISGYKAASATPAASGGAEMDAGSEELKAELEAAKAKVAELEGQLSTMKADEKARKDAADAAADVAERKTLDDLAKRLDYTPTWRADTKTSERKLDLARHKGLVAKDAAAPSEPTLNGMIEALKHLHADGTTADAATETTTQKAWDDASPKTLGGGNLSAQPFSARKDRKADPFKARLDALHTPPAATK